MLKKFVDKQKDVSEKGNNKALDSFNKSYRKDAEKLLMPEEEIVRCYGLLADFACITNKRLFFVDAKITGKKKVVSVPFSSIVEVSCDYGYVAGEVEVVTKNGNHELKMIKGIAGDFVNQLLERVC